MVRFLMALTETQRFRKINHYFLTRSHSIFPCDRDFGLVKRKIKHYDRIYLPSEHEDIVRCASIPISEVATADIIDFKSWCLTIQSLRKKAVKYDFKLSRGYESIILLTEKAWYRTSYQ